MSKNACIQYSILFIYIYIVYKNHHLRNHDGHGHTVSLNVWKRHSQCVTWTRLGRRKWNIHIVHIHKPSDLCLTGCALFTQFMSQQLISCSSHLTRNLETTFNSPKCNPYRICQTQCQFLFDDVKKDYRKNPSCPNYTVAQSYPVIKVLALAKEEQNWIILLSTNFLILIMIILILIYLENLYLVWTLKWRSITSERWN